MVRRYTVTGLFSDGGRDVGSRSDLGEARLLAESAIHSGAQRVIITMVQETHVETIRQK
jgi:hypothetical protein